MDQPRKDSAGLVAAALVAAGYFLGLGPLASLDRDPGPTVDPQFQPLVDRSSDAFYRKHGITPSTLPSRSDLDCADMSGPVPVGAADPHGLDGDGDRIGCE